MSRPIIEVENLSKCYRLGAIGATSLRDSFGRWTQRLRGQAPKIDAQEFWALRDVSFTVQPGEVVGIIGRNGAGKSTLLKILSRITEPTSGRARMRGRVASLLEVGTGFHPDLTGRENIFLNGAILGMSRAEVRRKFDEIVAFAEVDQFIDTPVKRYSSGMYVRLAFAVAAHLEPEILIVDEVLAVGDAQFQKKCLGKIHEVADSQGRTVLLVSHNIAAINSLSSHCLYLERGQLRFYGDKASAIALYHGADGSDEFRYLNKAPDAALPRIESVKLTTSLPGNIHVQGDPFAIEIILHTPRPIVGACLSVQIFDSEQRNFVHLWTHDVQRPMCRQAGYERVMCEVPRLSLYMGRYRLRVIFTEPPGGAAFQTAEGICPFEVIMRDNKRLFQWWPDECAYLESADWSISPP